MLAFISVMLTAVVFSQEVDDPLQMKFDHLKKLNGQVSDANFNKIAFADFSKFIIGDDNQFGRAINYVSLQVDKPKATLNLYQKTGEFGFFNFQVSGGFENDLISVVSNKSVASSFSSTLSYSFIFGKSYKYYGSDKHYLWGKMLAHFDQIYTADIETEIKTLDKEIDKMNKWINKEFYKREAFYNQKRLDTSKKRELIAGLGEFKDLKDRYEKKVKLRDQQVAFKDSLERTAKWSTRKLFWITPAVTYGGIGYKFYNKNASDGKLLSDKNAYTRTAILSLNFLYKSDHGKWFNKAANNLLLTGAVSYGRQNNFNKLKSSEFKAVEKTDSAANNASYTRTESYSVYTDTPTIFKEYDAFNTYFEAVKLFGENGTIGLRNRLTWEMPEEKSNVNNQVNWEFGILFNTTTKKDQDISKFSVELFVNFKDLGGKNVLEKDLEQKFYERHTVGVRTNLPFRFLSL